MTVESGGLDRDDVRALLAEHLLEMHATSPACSVHALDLTGLQDPAVTFWTVREAGALLGCGALKQLSPTHGEVKSMRTSPAARGRGVAALVLATVLDEARRRGYDQVSLETGSQDHFAPARRLYARHGFVGCGPFEGYGEDPNSTFMTLDLRT
ncbi:GNAT family N-acetyltransferase [Lapillicoccus jejuensis]|nr:GNAT family N-acetyltransferase [Lapillicoccus jejuensis]